MPALQFSNRSALKAGGRRKRYINGTNTEQTGGLSENMAAAWRSKVRNISNFCEQCCGNFFRTGTILPPKALIPEEKLSKIELKRPATPKNQGILATCSFALVEFP